MALPRITGSGNLTADPELRYTPNGKAVASFSVASNRKAKDGMGEDKVFFARCSAWDALGENIASTLHKGDYVSYEGSIEQRTYEKDGERKTSVDVTVFQVGKPIPTYASDGGTQPPVQPNTGNGAWNGQGGPAGYVQQSAQANQQPQQTGNMPAPEEPPF